MRTINFTPILKSLEKDKDCYDKCRIVMGMMCDELNAAVPGIHARYHHHYDASHDLGCSIGIWRLEILS